MIFGQIAKKNRIQNKLTLREFCRELGLDPSNWSKVERGVTPPPKDISILEGWADYFKLGGDDRLEFLDAARIARKEIPEDLTSNEELMGKLPAFFRAIRGTKMSGEKIDAFIEDIRSLNSPDKN